MTVTSPGSVDEDFAIRPGREADLPAMARLDEDVTGTAKPDYWRRLFQETRGEESRYVFVAEHQGRLAGFIIGGVRAWEFGSEPCGWVFTISVRGDYREHGLASALFATLCEAFRVAGVRKMRTMVRRDNHLIMAFFRSQGMMAGPFLQLEKELTA